MERLSKKLIEIGQDLKSPINTDNVLNPNDKLLDNQDLAFLLKVFFRTLQRYRASSKQPYFTISYKTYYCASDIRVFVLENADCKTYERFKKENQLEKHYGFGKISSFLLYKKSKFLQCITLFILSICEMFTRKKRKNILKLGIYQYILRDDKKVLVCMLSVCQIITNFVYDNVNLILILHFNEAFKFNYLIKKQIKSKVNSIFKMAKTLEQGFDTFIGWLQPLDSEHNKAKSHKDSVKSCMENNFDCSLLFETGSFGHETGVRHYSDTDYFAVCPSAKFWNDSAYTLRKVKEALQNTFWNTSNIEVKSPAVRIPFGNYSSETLELTPATRNGLVSTPVGDKYSYDIPNGDGGWMQSSPGAHNAYVDREDKRLNHKLKPLIQLVKAWKYYNNIPICSFYLELRVTKYAEKESFIVYDIDLYNIIKYLHSNSLPSIQDPMGISGYVKACSTDAKKQETLSKLKTGFSRAEKAYGERSENLDNCFYWWNLFFNYEFPNR